MANYCTISCSNPEWQGHMSIGVFGWLVFLHSLWLVLSVDRPNREIELVMVWNATLESAWRTEVFLALFLRSSCSAWSIRHFDWAIIFFEALSITFRGYEAGLFHAYWVITSSCGLSWCFGKCFLTGFDHRYSLPLNDFILLLFQYYLLDLRAFIAANIFFDFLRNAWT